MNKFLKNEKESLNDENDLNSSSNQKAVSRGASKTKTRRYDDKNLAMAFTATIADGEERPYCLLCNSCLAADSLKPSKLKRYFITMHGGFQDKPLSFFENALERFAKQQMALKVTSLSKKALLASYKVAYRIAKCIKAYNIAEQLILPSALVLVETLLGKKHVQVLKAIPLSNNTISRRISFISTNVQQKLHSWLDAKLYALQLDETTDCNNCAQLIFYISFYHECDIREELFFCIELKERATGANLFAVLEAKILEAELQWEKCVSICTDGAKAMSVKYNNLQAMVKLKLPFAT
ncbi:hypothetical protein ENBRE01_3308 [Enteropsectra breve]|nr:hypothetical protein ENBRE01_3308 [Enteropsectra breve]